MTMPDQVQRTIPVYLMDGNKVEVTVGRMSSADDVRNAVCQVMRLDAEFASLFCLWAMSGVPNLLALELPGNVAPLDLEPEWTRLLKYFCEKKKRRKTPDWYECRLTLRTRALVPIAALRAVEHPVVVRLLFHEATHAALETKFFNLSLDKQVQLAALQLQSLDLNYNKKVHKKEVLAARVKALFSRNTLRLVNRNDLADLLLPAYKKQKDTTALEAMLGYLEVMAEEPLYGAVFFETIIKESPAFRDNEYCIIAMHSAAMYFCRSPANSDESMAVVYAVPYEAVMNWDYEETSFTIGILVNEALVTQRMYTKKGSLIMDLIERGTRVAQASIVGVPQPEDRL
eukprot:c6697_g1_i1.p1 GENE.c6697_g1_i1~~c6697_g1_i1.p1  ORF type:complete len:386 (+),score=99.81 c6697_g1_i1:131-1159(+)